VHSYTLDASSSLSCNLVPAVCAHSVTSVPIHTRRIARVDDVAGNLRQALAAGNASAAVEVQSISVEWYGTERLDPAWVKTAVRVGAYWLTPHFPAQPEPSLSPKPPTRPKVSHEECSR
jgi:hypothetical protein